MTNAETTTQWSDQIADICRRFEASLRSGDTFDGLDAWLVQVPEHVRGRLEESLERCRAEIDSDAIETRIVASDAVLGGFLLTGTAGPETQIFTHSGAVEQCGTFRGLSAEAIQSLRDHFVRGSFAAGTHLLRQGEPARGLHLIVSGSVDIVNHETGKRIDCDGAGSVLGEMSLLVNQPCSADVIATSEVEALVLSVEAYLELKRLHPELEIALSLLVSDRLGGRRHDALCGKTIGGYVLNRCINRGGMGVVYEATHVETDELVALKMLRHRFIYDDHMQSRFDQEASVLADLRHPNIITLRENFLAYRTRFLVLDLCDGADLFQLIRARGPLDEATARALIGQIACGLLYTQQAGVIHRDLKPSNVLVDRSGQARLTDFGLSKLLESEVLGNKAVGTPSYMPPEQFRTDDVGPECDWYALGCLIVEMLTGKMLFPPKEWMKLMKTKSRMVPGESWPEVPASAELRAIVCACLHPNRHQRHADLSRLARWAQPVEWLFQPIQGPVPGDQR